MGDGMRGCFSASQSASVANIDRPLLLAPRRHASSCHTILSISYNCLCGAQGCRGGGVYPNKPGTVTLWTSDQSIAKLSVGLRCIPLDDGVREGWGDWACKHTHMPYKPGIVPATALLWGNNNTCHQWIANNLFSFTHFVAGNMIPLRSHTGQPMKGQVFFSFLGCCKFTAGVSIVLSCMQNYAWINRWLISNWTDCKSRGLRLSADV